MNGNSIQMVPLCLDETFTFRTDGGIILIAEWDFERQHEVILVEVDKDGSQRKYIISAEELQGNPVTTGGVNPVGGNPTNGNPQVCQGSCGIMPTTRSEGGNQTSQEPISLGSKPVFQVVQDQSADPNPNPEIDPCPNGKVIWCHPERSNSAA